jgi:UDP-N-acetylmuramate--alanine ligase
MKTVSFCGISGSGMSALAQVLAFEGVSVRGSDRSFDQGKDESQKKALESLGIRIFPQDGSAVDSSLDCLYVSTAVEDSIPDVKKALSLGIPVRKRSDLLADIFNSAPYSIAVGGTSGKTTVTAMIGFILDQTGKKPLVINGGLLKNYADRQGIPNVILNHGNVCVAEADESDGSIEKYRPFVSVVNNISMDHKTLAELQELFADFAAKGRGGAVVNADCPNSRCLLEKSKNIVTFSAQNPHADVFVSDIKPLADGVSYRLKNKTHHLKLTGAFNVLNAAAAIAACRFLSVAEEDAATVLERFEGTKRRLDRIGTKNGITVIDDFAHNPDKVRASLSALRDYKGRLIVMFQPHGFSPMRLMGREIIDSFAAGLLPTDYLLMPEIFYAGGSVTKDISSKDLIDYAVSKGVQALYFENRQQIKAKILSLAQSGDRIVIMGARDNTLPDFCREILEDLS